ncbi:MAG: GAF domain-containing protein [Phormidesmis sp.]
MEKPQACQLVDFREGSLHRIANRIRQSLELQEILDATATEIRDYLEIDRVKVYKFYPNGNGIVISESIEHHRLPSLLGLNFPADDIPPYAKELFLRARQRSVVDITNYQIGLSPLDPLETEKTSVDGGIRYRPLDPCHAEYLNAMGVKSSIVVPIVLKEVPTNQQQCSKDASLWGLLACHHSEPYDVSESALQFIQAIVDQVGLAIAQSALLDQVRAQAEQEANINRVTTLLHASPTMELQSALEAAVATFQGAGGRLYLLADDHQAKELYTCGEQPSSIGEPDDRAVEENYLWKNFIHSVVASNPDSSGRTPWTVPWMRSAYSLGTEQSKIDQYPTLWAVTDLYREPLFRTLAPFFESTAIRSLLVIPLHHGTHVVGCLTIFRDEVNTEILWAGYHNPDTRQLMPRQSFEVWKQKKKGEGQAWTEQELNYAQALSERFSAAIKQYRLYQQVQGLNATLEAQVKERTSQLQHSNQALENAVSRQAALASIVSKIRESLDVEEIFRVTTQELSQVMTADRVVVYQLGADRERAAVAFEYMSPQWTDIGTLAGDTWEDIHLHENQGDQNQNAGVLVIDDVYQQGFPQHHIELYERFHIKAFITVPISVGQDLWGILGVYQHQASRHWQPSEVEFPKQIAAQLGVALQHASLLERDRRKKEALSKTLINLKETQAQLIHTEKMSSLGQLVAGIAHEINNPVNFIHANLAHFNDYSQKLFRVLASYQAHYPEPADNIKELLAEADLDYLEEDLPKLCSSLSMGTKRIQTIVSSLRNFSRLDESAVKVVDIHEGIESTLLILQHRLETSNSKVTINIVKQYGDLPRVECHAGQMNQVLMHLIVNAVDELQSIKSVAEATTKTIIITTEQTKADWVKVSIQDDGKGVQPAILARLFDPFFTTKSVGKGTGLGLSISYKIVEQHGGKLYCQSVPGEGAEFIIELPIKAVRSCFAEELSNSV